MSEKLLNEIFGNPKWGRYDITYCELCDVIIIICPDCKNTTCNGMGCKKCYDDFKEFRRLKNQVEDYLSEEERKVLQKSRRLKRKIIECMEMGWKEVDFKKLKEKGHWCEMDDEWFKDELL